MTKPTMTATAPEPQELDPFTATMIAEGVDEATEEEYIAAWQYLHTSKLAYSLQGWFGRQAQAMLRAGIIHD